MALRTGGGAHKDRMLLGSDDRFEAAQQDAEQHDDRAIAHGVNDCE